MPPQLTLNSEDGAAVAPTTQANLGNQPPQSFGPHCVAANPEPCWLKHGCLWLAHGTICAGMCEARRSGF